VDAHGKISPFGFSYAIAATYGGEPVEVVTAGGLAGILHAGVVVATHVQRQCDDQTHRALRARVARKTRDATKGLAVTRLANYDGQVTVAGTACRAEQMWARAFIDVAIVAGSAPPALRSQHRRSALAGCTYHIDDSAISRQKCLRRKCMNMRRFDNWADYNNAVDEEYRYDREREPWPVHYDASGTGIDNDRSELPASELRILFLPHGFALSAADDEALGNIVVCNMSEQGPVALLAERVRFSVAKHLLTRRPSTLNRAMNVLDDALGGQ
jgi:hypothetical protein